MSISPDVARTRSPEEEALTILKGHGNPFELLASPHRATDNFGHVHVDEIHMRDRQRLIRAIDAYRLPEYTEFGQLPRTRAITILGDRGSGKTHLLQTLIDRPDQRAQVVIRPSTLEPGLEFEEYLLGQIRIALGERDEFHLDPPLELIAQSLTRRLLLQALRHLSPTEQLFALNPSAIRSWRLLWGGAAKQLRRWAPLLDKLSKPGTTQNLHALIVEHGLTPEQVVRLVEAHLRRMEASTSPLLIVRRALYTAMARRVLLEDNEVLPHFLREGYLLAGGVVNSSRSELVRPLLQVLVEACALCRMPVVFAFDNFERLFSPLGTFEADLTRGFLKNLAQAVDATHGLLFLLFFERGMYEAQVAHQFDDFIRARMDQGVRLSEGDTLSNVLLAAPTGAEVTCLVRTRVQHLVVGRAWASRLSPSFPFPESYLEEQVGTGSTSLRNVLIQLRERYAAIVHEAVGETEGPTPLPPPSPVNWQVILEEAWQHAMDATRRVVSSATHQEFHEALGVFLQALGCAPVEGWTLNKLIPTDPIGDHPSYGVVTRVDWRQTDGANLDGPRELRVGIGFLLAERRGTLVDLRSKFDYFDKYDRGARLVILWPVEAKGDLIEIMSVGTRQVWDDNQQYHTRTQIRRVAEVDLRRLLCLRVMPRYLEEAAPPPDVYAVFLRERLSGLLPLLIPHRNAPPA